MSNILILADHDSGKVAKTAAELATLGKRASSVNAVILSAPGQSDALAAQLANTVS